MTDRNDCLEVDIVYIDAYEFLADFTAKLDKARKMGGTNIEVNSDVAYHLDIEFVRPETDDERKRREQIEVAHTERKHQQIKELADELGYIVQRTIDRDPDEEDNLNCGPPASHDPDLDLPQEELKAKNYEKWCIMYGRGGF